jgi:hypothetical protein
VKLTLLAFAVLLLAAAAGAVELPLDKSSWQVPRWATNVSVVQDDGRPAFKLVTSRRDGGQQIRYPVIFPADVARIVFDGRMKTENVAGGVAPIEKARAQIGFLNIDGDHIGDWPKTTDCDGTTSWTPFHQDLVCPPGTRAVEVMIGMFYCTGTACFADLRVQGFDADGREMEPTPTHPQIHTDTSGWIVLSDDAEDTSRPLVVDFSPYLPAPAGQFGFVTNKDGHFAFENGRRVRFWGTGYVKNWCPPKDQAPAIAGAWARAGINLIRLHGMDAQNPKDTIFDITSDRTDRLDAAKLDRLDYLIAQCKQRGVYIDLNLLTKRRYTAAEGVSDFDRLPQGGKAASMFDRRLIELQKDYDRLILEHVNPYTRLAYKDDPVIAMLEIINETSLLDLAFSGGLPASYEESLNDQFVAWCQQQNIERPKEHYRVLAKTRNELAARFAETVEKRYFDEQYAFLRNDLKVRVPISGTQTDATLGERRAQFGLNLFDRHAYWDHPAGGWDPFSTFINKPMVKVVSKWNVFDYLLGQRVMGKPFMVSEWNFAWPNDYITEGPLLMAAYAGYNDWDAAMIFGTGGLSWAPAMSDTFGHENKPHVMLPLMASALSFYRGDVRPGPVTAVNVGRLPANTNLVRGVFSREELFTRQCVLTDDDAKATRPATRPSSDLPNAYRTADGQIDWTSSGRFVLNTPHTQAVLGFVANQPTATKDLSVTIGNPFGQVIVTSLTDQPIANSPRLLITATARAENDGQAFRPFRKSLTLLGRAPILLEPVKATIKFNRGGAKPAVYALDRFGRRTDRQLAANPVDNGWMIDLGTQSAGWFEVFIAPQ